MFPVRFSPNHISAAEKKVSLGRGRSGTSAQSFVFCVFLCSEVIFSCKSHRSFFQKLPLQCRHLLENPLAKNPKTHLLNISHQIILGWDISNFRPDFTPNLQNAPLQAWQPLKKMPKIHAQYDWTTIVPDNGNEWRKFSAVPRLYSLRPLVLYLGLIGVERGRFPLYGGTFARSYSVSTKDKWHHLHGTTLNPKAGLGLQR